MRAGWTRAGDFSATKRLRAVFSISEAMNGNKKGSRLIPAQ
jgi:hypothetical protein